MGQRIALLAWTIGAGVVALAVAVVAGAAVQFIRDPERVGHAPPPREQRTAEEQARLFQPGPVWQGNGTHKESLTQEQIEQFVELPVYWFGTAFAGYNLTDVYWYGTEMILTYGTCPWQEQRCSWPASIMIQSVCKVRPEQVADVVKAGPPETVRGGGLLQRDTSGGLHIWTGQVKVSLFVDADPALRPQAIEELRGANALAGGVGPGDPLPPPDFAGCPPLPVRYQPGTPFEPAGKNQSAQAQIDAFDAFPLLWLGLAYGGYHLQAVGVPADSGQETTGFNFYYGLCPGEDLRFCTPVLIEITPACAALQEQAQAQERRLTDPAALPGSRVVRGGAVAQQPSRGDVRLWTGRIHLLIRTDADPALADTAIEQLHGVGQSAARFPPDAPLPRPDLSGC